MASSSTSEESETCSVTGSVLVTPLPDGPNPFPFLCRSQSSDFDSDLDCAFDELPSDPTHLSINSRPPKDDPTDWIHWETLDPALIRFTLDEADPPHLQFSATQTTSSQHAHKDGEMAAADRGDDKAQTSKPFHKWMKTLRRRAGRRQHTSLMEQRIYSSVSMDFLRVETEQSSHQRQSSSGSSFGFVDAVKTASVSLASGSVFTRSRRNSVRSSRTPTHTDRSSRASFVSNRCSEDSTGLDKPSSALDKEVLERSLQRRRILEELINTEEGYIGDVRFLMNVYVTILVSLPTMPQGLRSSINRNLGDIVDLHEELLGDLHRAVPHSEYAQLGPPSQTIPRNHGHQRMRSLDSVPEDNAGMPWMTSPADMVAEPSVAADVAKVFANKMNRFFIYEEYGAKYEMMMKDVASVHRTIPQWKAYQKGLETLASSLGASRTHHDKSKQSLTIGDLLVKPIQRVCKYPLLFAELLKYTPVVDSPYAHMEIENTLIRLREATSQINRATDDALVRTVLEKTWLLQDRLVFPDSRLDAASKNRIRSFGHIELCGVLYACWQTKDKVQGQYLVTLLYKEWLCLASASRADQIYTLQACIPLNQVKVEAVDNGRGLQCHTAPFSWKIVFECDCHLYEMMLTACTPKEEDGWRSRLNVGSAMKTQDQDSPDLYNALFLNMKSQGTVFGKQGSIARSLSIHRATTVGPKSPLCNIILRNTTLEKDILSSANATINRSQSLLATKGRVPVLTPPRADRARLEALLSDVWTREILPFPGITARARNEHLIRSSAHSMIRKLSVTSIASTFSKRSPSLASIARGDSDEETGEEYASTQATAKMPHGKKPAPPPLDVQLALQQSRNSHSSIGVDSNGTSSKMKSGIIHNDAETLCNSLQQMRITKSPSAWQLREHASGFASNSISPSPTTPSTRALRARSMNGPQLTRRLSLQSRDSAISARSGTLDSNKGMKKKKSGLFSKNDGNKSLGHVPPKSSGAVDASATDKSSTNRWSRMDMLRRGTVAQGFREIFR